MQHPEAVMAVREGPVSVPWALMKHKAQPPAVSTFSPQCHWHLLPVTPTSPLSWDFVSSPYSFCSPTFFFTHLLSAISRPSDCTQKAWRSSPPSCSSQTPSPFSLPLCWFSATERVPPCAGFLLTHSLAMCSHSLRSWQQMCPSSLL